MALSRKRQQEFTRLKAHAEATIQEQREILEHAATVIRDATREATNYGLDTLASRANAAYQRRIRPVVAASSFSPLRPTGPRSGGGPGKYILLGLGIVALAGVAYAAWQTVRTDDDLWIDDGSIDDSGSEFGDED